MSYTDMIINNYAIQTKSIKPSFASYRATNPITRMPASTDFYHDYPTLKESVRLLEQNFPEGCDILVYAGSNGEEAISIYSMLQHPERYNIHSIDPFKEAINTAQKGIFRVGYAAEDNFLILNNSNDIQHREQRACFKKCFIPVEKIDPYSGKVSMKTLGYIFEAIQNMGIEELFLLKPEVKERINFVEGDIRNIDSFKTQKPVGAVFFRNALYHLTHNNIMDTDGFSPDYGINRRKILKNLMDSVDRKLSPNGIFVMGHHLQEHMYLADPQTSFAHTKLFGPFRVVDYPLNIKALEENGHFVRKFVRDITEASDNNKAVNQMMKMHIPFSVEIPLIWQKIR